MPTSIRSSRGPSNITWATSKPPPKAPMPRWAPEEKIEAGVNTYMPFRDISESIICNMQNPWRLTLANSAAISWSYRDPPPPPNMAVCEFSQRPYRIYVEKVIKVPVWYNHFHIAVRSNQFEDHESRAKLLVKSEDTWGPNEISHLVYSFVGRASNAVDDEEVCSVASFAQQVCYHFENHRPSAYDQFHDCFGRILIGTFLACWDQNCEWSMVRIEPRELGTYLPASLRLATFLGMSLKYGLLSTSDVRPCVRLLLSQANYVEYIHAVRSILEHAEDTFWKDSFNREEDIDAFLQSFNRDVDGIVGGVEYLGDHTRGYHLVSPYNLQWDRDSILNIVYRHGRNGC